jgi:hypothetical protein
MSLITVESFADESHSHDINTTPWYVVGGYFGSARNWRLFVKLWRKAIATERIRDIGFHANKCIRGKGVYSEILPERRRRIQQRLIAAVKASKLTGIVASIDMNVYRSVRARLSAKMLEPVKKFNNPYCLSFHQFIQLVFKIDKSTRRIKFTFHRRPKGNLGSAPEWYDGLKKQKSIPWHNRLGPFEWNEPSRAIALDAADMLAYCGYQHLSGNFKQWQWDALNDAGLIVPFTFDQGFWKNEILDKFDDV